MATALEENVPVEDNTKGKCNYKGPDPNVKYPLTVLYCGECGLPVELCEYSPNPDACKDWLEKNHPEYVLNLNKMNVSNDQGESEKKSSHQRRGGKGMAKPKKEKAPSRIVVSKQQRKGNKYVTIISGLSSNDVDIEVAKKFFAQKFCCGCSKGENDELIIQGDVLDNLFTVIPERFPQISEDMMEEKS